MKCLHLDVRNLESFSSTLMGFDFSSNVCKLNANRDQNEMGGFVVAQNSVLNLI